MENTATKRLISLATLAGAVAVASSQASAQTNVPKPTYKFEKCYGVAKAGMNDCFTRSNACGGTTKLDNEPQAWVYVPVGICQKLTGGALAPKNG